MNISISLTLTPERKKKLVRALASKETELATTLSGYARAALEEHLAMYEGDKVFTRGSDIHEYRLFLLIKHVFDGRIPDEKDVSRHFQLTASQSRGLIRAVMSKYQTALQSEIDETLKKVLGRAAPDNNTSQFTVAIFNQNIVDELNRRLTLIDPSHLSVQKQKDSVSTFTLAPASYAALCEELDVTAKKLDV